MQPSFICIGFQKCGTTTLWDIMRQHSGIVLTQDVKEPMYYRVKGLRTIGGKKWYERRYFGNVSESDPRMPGEVNAGLTFGNAPKKIAKDFSKDTKFIFMMRNPVDRSYSAYKYFLALGFLPMHIMRYDAKHGHAEGFDHYVHYVLDDENRRAKILKRQLPYLVFSQSMYQWQIEQYTKNFPIENMHFVIFEEFIKDQEAACKEIYSFLGLPEDPNIQYGITSNEGVSRPASPLLGKIGMFSKGRNYVTHEFFNLPKYWPWLDKKWVALYEFVQKKCVVPDADRSKMLDRTRFVLEDFYREQKKSVERIIHHSLDDVWYN